MITEMELTKAIEEGSIGGVDCKDFFTPYDDRIEVEFINARLMKNGIIKFECYFKYLKNLTSNQSSLFTVADILKTSPYFLLYGVDGDTSKSETYNISDTGYLNRNSTGAKEEGHHESIYGYIKLRDIE